MWLHLTIKTYFCADRIVIVALEAGNLYECNQELMRIIEAKGPTGAVTVMDRVVKRTIKSAANCPIPLCQSYQFPPAKQHKPEVSKSKALPSAEVSLSHDKYESGDFVFLDQYVKAPGHFLEGFGSESDTNMFHGGTIFCDAASTFMFITHIFGCQWDCDGQTHLKIGCGGRLMLLSNITTVTMDFYRQNFQRILCQE